MTATAFRSHLKDNIAQIRIDVRNGSYRFSKLRMAAVPKSDNKFRIIAIPTVRDRLLQRSILRHLESSPRFTPNSAISYGFAKGRSLAQAQSKALEHRNKLPWVLKADIVQFFDRIPREELKKLIRRHVNWKIISELLCHAVDCEIETASDTDADFIKMNGIRKGRGLRQGMPISPMLSNLLLKSFDEELTKAGIVAIRYADDIAVFAKNRNECTDALKIIKDALRKYKLGIPDLSDAGKTIIAGPSDAVIFLGVEIRRYGNIYKLTAPKTKIEKISETMRNAASIKNLIASNRTIAELSDYLNSFIIGHRSAMSNINDRDIFFAHLEEMKSAALKSTLSAIFGEDVVRRLDRDQMSVLGLTPFPQTSRPGASRAR